MTAAALVVAVLLVLTLGLGFISAAGARPSHELDAERRQAEDKSLSLLRSWLTADQHEQWECERQFEVTGSDAGKRYRITDSMSMNVLQLDRSGHTVAKFCFLPEGSLALGDFLLAQKVLSDLHEFRV
jgi:hypothetical protein